MAAGTPPEIRTTVTESFNHAKATWASLYKSSNGQQHAIEISEDLEDRRQLSSRPGPSSKGCAPDAEGRLSTSNFGNTTSSDSAWSLTTGRQFLGSLTSAGSSPRLQVINPATYQPDETAHVPRGPLSAFNHRFNKELEKNSRKHGLMDLLLGREHRPRNLKQESNLQLLDSPNKECASCFEDVPPKAAIGLACQHSYCSPCFSQLIATAMQHESFWPPKCCLQEISKKTLQISLSALDLAKYRIKAREYSIPVGERWYCLHERCGKWFEKSKFSWRDTKVRCPHCRYDMCPFCRGPLHAADERCVQDRGIAAILATADLEGWRRCYRCHTMVELNRGCQHITCTCGAQFWYT